MILHPRFYEVPEIDREAERRKLGLDPGLPTALVLFGGFGSMTMKSILNRLDASGQELQAIFVCGRNERLRRELERAPSRIRKHVVGFTSEVPYYMKLSDFFIGKPGPGSVSEAVQLGLPVITVSNFMTLPQERYNAVWLEENELGLLLRSFDGIDDATRRLLEGDRLQRYRSNCAKMRNRAIFEIPDLLDRIWQQHHAA
jgi:1,2-diacylglycerol 3-beta-galactosyltransferase